MEEFIIGDVRLKLRELEMLYLVAEGWTNGAIATYYDRSEKTIEKYLGTSDATRAIYPKIDVFYRDEAATWVEKHRYEIHAAFLSSKDQTVLDIETTRHWYAVKKPIIISHLITSGDVLSRGDQWQEAALHYYTPALRLMSIADDKARLITDRFAQTYTNAGAYELSEKLLDAIPKLFEEARLYRQEISPEFRAGMLERKGWIYGYRGEYQTGKRNFLASRPLAEELGQYGRVATTHHFVGRQTIEQFIPLLFQALNLKQARIENLEQAMQDLAFSKNYNKLYGGEPNIGYGLLWEAKGYLLLNEIDDAKRRLFACVDIFHNANFTASAARSELEIIRLHMLTSDSQIDLKKQKHAIARTISLLLGHQHPYALTEAYCLSAYCDFLIGDYRNNTVERLGAADKCELAMKLHPFAEHAYYVVAKTLQDIFLYDLEDDKKLAYRKDLLDRMVARRGIFHALDYALHTRPNEYAIHLANVENLVANLID